MEECPEESDEDASLVESDIAGASLNGRKPEELTVPQLKRWLQCRKASLKGKKSDLVAR